MERSLTSQDKIDTFDINKLQQQYERLSTIIRDSINNKTAMSMIESLKKLMGGFERIFNQLGITSEKDYKIFYFGCISSIANLIIEIEDDKGEVEIFDKAIASYAHLLPALEIIYSKKSITGKELRKSLNMTMSGLSNFIKRIDELDLIITKKVGTTNFYQLTHKAENLLRVYKNKRGENENESQISFSVLLKLLDSVVCDLNEDEPNPVRSIAVCKKLDFTDSQIRILKNYIDSLYLTRSSLNINFKNKQFDAGIEKFQLEESYNISDISDPISDYDSNIYVTY